MPNTPDQMVGHRIVTPFPAVHKKADAEVIRSQNLPKNLTVCLLVFKVYGNTEDTLH